MEVGYLYKGCVHPVWEVKVAYLPGCDMSASDIGGWNLHIHHVYNWRYGIVYRGDGSHLYLPMQPWRLRPLIGDGHTPRDAACTTCSESLFIYKRVREPTALATDRMGNVYMMDGLQLRKINPAISEIVTIGHVMGKRAGTAGGSEIGGEGWKGPVEQTSALQIQAMTARSALKCHRLLASEIEAIDGEFSIFLSRNRIGYVVLLCDQLTN